MRQVTQQQHAILHAVYAALRPSGLDDSCENVLIGIPAHQLKKGICDGNSVTLHDEKQELRESENRGRDRSGKLW